MDQGADPREKRFRVLEPRHWIVLVVLMTIAIFLSLPHFQHTYIEAYFLGKCSETPPASECAKPGSRGAGRQFDDATRKAASPR
jgi:hypothetical protein